MEKYRQIPLGRIMEKMNEYWDRKDRDGAERLLFYWLKEAESAGDRQGELVLLNELAGHFRKAGKREEALFHAEEALSRTESREISGTILEGTTCVNAATVCQAFGESARALPLFERAKRIYESNPAVSPELLGGLYNNMGLTLQSLERYPEALALYEKALSVMERIPGKLPEMAITCLNMADTLAAEKGPLESEEETGRLLDRAFVLLMDERNPRDGYFAFVCEKCAPGFSHYGYFAAAAELKKEAEKIYERNGAGESLL